MAQLRTRKESKNTLKSSLANHLLTFLARHRWLGEYDNFLERNLFQSVYGQGFALLTRSTQNFWRGLSVPACFGWLAHWPIVIRCHARACLRSLSLYIGAGPHSGASPLQICTVGFWRGKIHTPARSTTCHALAPGAALTYNTANTGFTQARSLHGLCQQLLQLYTVSYS